MIYKFAILPFLVMSFMHLAEAKVVPVVDNKYEDCTKGESAGVISLKNLEFMVKDDQYFINGKTLTDST